jgi:hypothetical protein
MEHLKLLITVEKIKSDYYMLHPAPRWLMKDKEEINLLIPGQKQQMLI